MITIVPKFRQVHELRPKSLDDSKLTLDVRFYPTVTLCPYTTENLNQISDANTRGRRPERSENVT